MRRSPRRLAAPLVMTFAMLPACASGTASTATGDSCKPPDCHMNPPPDRPLPEPAPSATAAASSAASDAPAVSASAPPTAAPVHAVATGTAQSFGCKPPFCHANPPRRRFPPAGASAAAPSTPPSPP